MSVGNMGVIGRGDFDSAAPGPIGPAGPTGGIVVIEQESHGFKVGECVRYSGTSWVLARADSEYTLAIGVIVEIGDADSFTYAMTGRFNVTHGLSVDTWYYLSPTVDGGLTTEQPGITQPIILTDDPFHYSVMQYRPALNRDGDHSGGTEGPAGPAGATGPAGPTGSRGLQGPQGQPGPYGPIGPIGPVGAEGIQGTTGLQGTAASLNVGATDTVPAGNVAKVTNSGNSSSAIFNFAIPQGAQGVQGPIGTGIQVKGTVPNESDLPQTNNTVGDVFVVTSTNDAYVWAVSKKWANVGPIGLTGAYLPLSGGAIDGSLSVSQPGSGLSALAIGDEAGLSDQQQYSTAIGFMAGNQNQGYSSVALGQQAGSKNQGTNSIAIGNAAAQENQGDFSVAIGYTAGVKDQGSRGIIIQADDYEIIDDTSDGHIHIKSGSAELSYTDASEWQFSEGNVDVSSLSVGGVSLDDLTFDDSNLVAGQAAQDVLIADNANAIAAGQSINAANTAAINALAYQSSYDDNALAGDIRAIEREQDTQDSLIAANTALIKDFVSFDPTALEAEDAYLQEQIDTNIVAISAFSAGSGNLDGGVASSNYGGIPYLNCGDARSFT